MLEWMNILTNLITFIIGVLLWPVAKQLILTQHKIDQLNNNIELVLRILQYPQGNELGLLKQKENAKDIYMLIKQIKRILIWHIERSSQGDIPPHVMNGDD